MIGILLLLFDSCSASRVPLLIKTYRFFSFSAAESDKRGPHLLEAKKYAEKMYGLLWPRSHYSDLRFCESVHTDPHKNATKTEVFENAIESGYPQKRRFLKMVFDQCERTKTEVFENAQISNNELHKNGAM